MTTAAAIKERPILFSAPMIRAILGGRKTQTRRVVKPQMEPAGGSGWDGIRFFTCVNRWCLSKPSGGGFVRALEVERFPYLKCPYGQPGDRLWVRETWGMSFVDIAMNRRHVVGGTWGSDDRPKRKACAVYRADGDAMPDDPGREVARWCPSIHMPRWASRITLEVTGVRVERVQDITEADAVEEGAPGPMPSVQGGEVVEFGPPTHRDGFRDLWHEINGAASWDANPWVWVVSFKRIEGAQ